MFSDAKLNTILMDDALDDVAKTDYLAEHLSRTVSLKKRPETSDPRKMTEVFYGFARKLYRGGTADGLTGLANGVRSWPPSALPIVIATLLRTNCCAHWFWKNATPPMEESAFLRLISTGVTG